jgi:uncharacterized membrane protein
MYPAVLLIHSWLRWIVVLAGLVALVRAIAGWSGGRRWTSADNRLGAVFTGTLDLQLVLGLLLYLWLSPITRAAFDDMGAAMRVSAMRFWLVEHLFGMIVAVVLAHVGRVRIRRATDARQRHRIAAIFFGLALVIIFITIPWPGLPYARPLIRW